MEGATGGLFDKRRGVLSAQLHQRHKKVHEVAGIVKIAWVPPEFGAAVACVGADGTLSLWEEVAEDAQPLQWKLCISFNSGSAQLLDTQFGVLPAGLKMVTTYSDAHVKFYKLLNPLGRRSLFINLTFQFQHWQITYTRAPIYTHDLVFINP
ncbi:hypothetical protein C1H46_043074 [Malus baccata]|uniref:Uncharacterized protein n=1 Tax=Malus baccata TaxID=106549 RepID=A0A540KB03_MALBA|nr:hypothetical protein C1H46_043074 [Malus baccata]